MVIVEDCSLAKANSTILKNMDSLRRKILVQDWWKWVLPRFHAGTASSSNPMPPPMQEFT